MLFCYNHEKFCLEVYRNRGKFVKLASLADKEAKLQDVAEYLEELKAVSYTHLFIGIDLYQYVNNSKDHKIIMRHCLSSI